MRQICLLVAMSMMSSVSGRTCENLWDEAGVIRGPRVHAMHHPATAVTECGQRPAFPDLKRSEFRGVDDSSDRVNMMLGSYATIPGEFPWRASLFIMPIHMICGGVILNDFWVLTIAQCVYNVTSVMQVKVALGMYDINIANDLSSSNSVEKIFIHQNYTPGMFDYDIALIKLCTHYPISFDDYIQPICLPELEQDVPVGTELIFAGYGQHNDYNWNVPAQLRKVFLPVINYTICRNSLYLDVISERMMCAGYIGGNVNACFGDKGGPAVYKSGDKFFLAGVMAAGVGCLRTSNPVVFSSFFGYQTWINDVMSLNSNPGQVEVTWV